MTDKSFDDYLRGFDYTERKAMKIQLPELLQLYAEGKAQLVDIRFHEEYAAWQLGMGQHIPLNELPDRLEELPDDKLILACIVACPMTDRSNMARSYLVGEGMDARYLQGGLLGLMDRLKGGRAKAIRIVPASA